MTGGMSPGLQLFLSTWLFLQLLSDGGASKGVSYNHRDAQETARCTCTPLKVQKTSSCSCERVMAIPANLSTPLWTLSISWSEMTTLRAAELSPYRPTLRDLTLSRMKELHTIEPNTFQDMPHLRTIDISRAPLLQSLDATLFALSIPHLRTLPASREHNISYIQSNLENFANSLMLRIAHSGLNEIPSLNQLKTVNPLHTIDLESNSIAKIPSSGFNVRAEELLLSFNIIAEIEQEAFAGSQIAKLVLKGNWPLTRIHHEAFSHVQSLRKLDLSRTSIPYLPTKGLKELEVLTLQNTDSLKVFPSVYNFESIEEASLTYPYHCCAFQFPAQHSPDEYKRHQEFIMGLEKRCQEKETEQEVVMDGDWHHSHLATQVKGDRRRRGVFTPLNLTGGSHQGAQWGHFPLHNGSSFGTYSLDTEETFHEEGVTVTPFHHVTCGNLSKNYHAVRCHPIPDAFNPCEDLMGNWALRVAVWVVAVSAVFGNLAVLLVLVSSTFRMTVPKFLMCNLAVADLCMGLYLLLIAVMDVRSIGIYFNFAIDWQSGLGCKVAGFLTVLASELSIFTLAVITGERWYTITYAIHLNKRLKLKTAAQIMAAGWMYSVIMAILPLFGVSSFSKTSICLPLENHEAKDVTYLVTLLVFNGIAFLMICVCYSRMYFSIRGGQQDAIQARSDMTVAKRMALLVFTDFACWAPISFFGLTALVGYPLIDVPKTKILLVFFYPLNSCANPYLYALLTQQYRRDLFILLSRYGICSERAALYKGATGVKPRGNTEEVGFQMKDKCAKSGPNHRGSLLTSLTVVDNVHIPACKPSLVPVQEFKLELLPATPVLETRNGSERENSMM